MKKKLVVIGANNFQNQLIIKAKEKGYETHVFAWQCGDIGERTADYFYPISIIEKEQILNVCRYIRPNGVISIASDLASITVNYVAESLGLVGNGMSSVMRTTNKHLMRNTFEKAGLPSPKSIQVSSAEALELSLCTFPLIVKPTDRSGSRGVFKIEDPCQLAYAIERAKQESFEKKVLIEEYAEGDEYSIEYVSCEGDHRFLAITKKYTTGAPNFIETGHMEPAGLPEDVVDRVKDLIPRVLDCLDIRNGASHSELKIDRNDEMKLIEIGGRMGGDFIGSDLVYLSTGYDLIEMVIDIACGNGLQMVKKHEESVAAVRFIFDVKDLENLEWVKSVYPDAIYRISTIEPMDGRVINDSSMRYGYYLLSTKDRTEMEMIMGKING